MNGCESDTAAVFLLAWERPVWVQLSLCSPDYSHQHLRGFYPLCFFEVNFLLKETFLFKLKLDRSTVLFA